MKNITRLTLIKTYVPLVKEIARLQANDEYCEVEKNWGTQQNVENESIIFEAFLSEGLVTQDWFDDRPKHTNIELLKELLNVQ